MSWSIRDARDRWTRRTFWVVICPAVLLVASISLYNLPKRSARPFEDGHRIKPIQDALDSLPKPLLPLAFDPLPLGSIKPRGWLKDELTVMGHGLAGHQHDFYEFVIQSPWLGGDKEYSGINEAYPYWFNGLVPLAYSLDDERLKEQVHSTADYVLSHRHKDGWIGPESGRDRNIWARSPFCLGLKQLVEANSTWEEPVIDALDEFVHLLHEMLADGYRGYLYRLGDTLKPFLFMWGRVRAQEMILILQWLYEDYPRIDKNILWDSMRMLHEGSIDWASWYNEEVYIKEDLYRLPDSVTRPNYAYQHGVNVAQGWKAAAVIRRFTHNQSLVQTAMDGVKWTFDYHGAASGTVLADERIDGLSPYSGSELCTAVEAIYSLGYLYQALGDSYYADRAELATFNALPVMMTSDWWGHQYVAQPNQPFAKHSPDPPFWNTRAWGTTFGLEPNYPCCTVNFPQGLPKFLSASFVRVGNDGLAHVLLSPAEARASLETGTVHVQCETNYPFGNTLRYTITSENPVSFHLRVPDWYEPESSSIVVGHGSAIPLAPRNDSRLHKIELPSGESHIVYTLGSTIRIEGRANDTIAVYKGALLYALEVGSEETSTSPKDYNSNRELPAGYAPAESRDWQYTNTTRWNVAIDPESLEFYEDEADSVKLKSPIFAPGAPPTFMTAMACEIEWPLFKGMPGAVPTKDVRVCLGEAFQVTLRPYGSAKLHMSELPTMSLSEK